MSQSLSEKSVGANITVRPLSSALGAEIIGVDASEPLDAATVAGVQTAWYDHLVIVLRSQKLNITDQVRFCQNFGDIGKRLSAASDRLEPGGLPEGAMFISNIKQDGKNIGYLPDGEMQFHSDMCYVEKPHAGASLYAIEVPSSGGDTMFSNLYQAYAELPEDVRQRLEGLSATHYYDGEMQSRDEFRLNENLKHFTHPVIRTHPVTGKKSIFVSRLMTARIEGIGEHESQKLLSDLFDQIEKPEFIYRHVWKPGDLLMWDNRCTAHARTDFDPSERRHLSRVVLQGDRPF
jgi:taurine dioxygenase